MAIKLLPAEISRRVCEYLAANPPSLHAFALASRQCYAAATALIFRRIHITVKCRDQLVADVQRWRQVLERSSSLRHVRRLVIDGHMRKHPGAQGDDEEEDPFCTSDATDDDPFDPRWADVHIPYEEPLSIINAMTPAWSPLADFIRQLPALAEFDYGCANQLPLCLLNALHSHTRACRLTIRTFHLRSLGQPDLDQDELAVITSPCLYSINVRYDIYYSSGVEDYHEEAVQDIVAGLVPRLKQVRLYRSPAGWSPALKKALETPRRPWQGFPNHVKKQEESSGSLQALQLAGFGRIDGRHLETWSKHTNFSVLETLELPFEVHVSALTWAAAACPFTSLSSLTLMLYLEERSHISLDEYTVAAASFLRSLNPLSVLAISGSVGSDVFDVIMERHGRTVRKLYLEPDASADLVVLSPSEISRIRHGCLMLEHLTLSIPRTKGNAQEVAIYKALGTLPKLQSISLTLDASYSDPSASQQETPVNPCFDPFDQAFFDDRAGVLRRVRNGYIREAFINSALDEKLARAIFHTISASKPLGAFPLERLTLRVMGGGRFGVLLVLCSIEDVITQLARSWLIERDPRDDRCGEVIVRELNPPDPDDGSQLMPEVQPIFRKIWPESREGGNWREDWQSFSLEEA